jgi:4-hydroxythreonine-4-phosphate dehydrogenase
VVADLDSRQADSATAADAVRAVLAGAGGLAATRRRPATAAGDSTRAAHPHRSCLWYKKSDSLLRGNVGAEAAAFAEGAEAVVVAMALPGAARVVREGVLHIDGVPLHDSDAWRAEDRPPPPSLTRALDPLPVTRVPLEGVREGARGLARRLEAAAAQGLHPVCDAETDTDLTAIAEAALELGPGYRLLGSGGLAAALGRLVGTGTFGPRHEELEESAGTGTRPLLVVAGSAEPVVDAQIARLTAAGARHLPLDPGTLVGTDPAPLPPLAPGTVTVLSIDPSRGVRPQQARRLVAGLARSVAALPCRPDLVLTGGETARRVLDAVGVTTLRPVGEVHHGAVHSLTPDGRSVVTRPGSFGGPDSLHRIVTALRRRPPAPRHPTPATASPQQGVTQ